MKKALSFAMLFLCLLVFSGCTPNVKKNDNDNSYDVDGVKISYKYDKTFDFKNKLKTLVIFPFSCNYYSTTDEGKGFAIGGLMNFEQKVTKDTTFLDETSDVLGMELFDSGIKVLDRTFLERILKEQKLSLTGITDSNAKAIGKIMNADAFLWGTVSLTKSMANRTGKISVRIIDVETGNTVFIATGEKSDIWGGGDITSFKSVLLKAVGKIICDFYNERINTQEATLQLK